MMPKTIVARRLIRGSDEIQYPVLSLGKDGTILGIGSDERSLANDRTTLTAALFDIHMHGSRGIDVMNAGPAEFGVVQRFLAKHGVAQFLPTTVTASLDFTFRALERMADAIETGSELSVGARPIGIHIEGPFLSHLKRGMHPANALQRPSIELFEKMQQAARGHIRLVTIAPEPDAGPFAAGGHGFAPNTALELIRYLSAQGVRCSIGHTNARTDEAIAAIEAGAVSATHTFNAMRALDHREPGVLGVVLDDERLYADLICDGVHVTPSAARLWWKAKGPERAILITDALSATGAGEGEFEVGDTEVFVRSGRALVSGDLRSGKETLAGSVLTLERAVEKLREFTGATLAESTTAASHNAAAMLGLSDRTKIEPGAVANLARWDEDGNLLATYLRGEEIRAEP
ncbi:MAG TPA: N-acetylglucosamine-6-phosphate deacetylase [Terracidiphilus sp.]|jgi:N-acetylglucosamine-6-phosphate deacetylase